MSVFGSEKLSKSIATRLSILVVILLLNFCGVRSYQLVQPNHQKVDRLFKELQNAPNSIVAQQLESEIFVELSNSESEAINLLMASAQIAIEKKDFENAMVSIDEILRRNPNFTEARNNKAALLYRFGDKAAALHNLERIVETEPRLNAAWAAIGNIRYELSDIDGARTAFNNALYLNPYNEMAKRGLFDIESKTTGIGM